ncbi:MAG: trimethylamine methyltransferase family protein [bacterium]|nr:trimethylamine methyltransferase family protein [bacterium]
MAGIHVRILSDGEIRDIHEAALLILRDAGVMVHHEGVLKLLAEAGAQVERQRKIARFPEQLVMDCVARAGKKYVLYGRDPARTARFGYSDLALMSSPGQRAWIDSQTGQLRPATMQDLRDAIRMGDALPNITIVGSMAQPAELSENDREVVLTAELVKNTGKPTRTWVHNGRTARYVLEIYRAIAGDDGALRARPMVEAFLEPISPLQLPRDGLDVLIEFVRAGQPASIGPMAMASGTAPATLAGTLAQENAEILAGVVITQILEPGTPVTYGGIPHIMDPRTSICSFGSPEQALMAVAMVQMGRFYGFPVYINVGLTDSKVLDVQAGIEKASTMVLGALAGADTFGHAGICGTDHGAGLAWLAVDDAIMGYVKRIVRGFQVNPETIAADLVRMVGPAGSYLAEEHTVKHFREELWLPGRAWTRETWDLWEAQGRTSMADRILEEVSHILATHKSELMDEALAQEIDRIVECAKRELG